MTIPANSHRTPWTRRGLLAALGATGGAAALAACGPSAVTPGPSGDPTSAASGTRSVTDAAGVTVRVPATPAKVVTLHYAGTQAVLDLGGQLAGTAAFEEGIVPEPWLATLGKVPVVTTADGPNVEKIAGIGPDLILAPNTLKDDVLSQLRQIAPVYQFTLRGGKRAEWQTRVKEIANALDREAAFTRLQQDLAAEQQALAKEFASVAPTVVLGAVSSYEENTVYLWGSKSMMGTVLMPLGVKWSAQEDAAVAATEDSELAVSPEKLLQSLGDATQILYDTDLRARPSAFTTAVRTNPLYAQLPAVKAGNEFPIGKLTVAGFADARYSLSMAKVALAKVKR